MADEVATNVIFNGNRRYAARFTNLCDGTGEAAVKKIDISTLVGPDGSAPTRTAIEWIEYDVQGFTSVRLDWDHTTPDEIAFISGQGLLDFTAYGGMVDPASTGGTGDILLTTAGNAATNSYTITIGLRLKD